MNPVQREIMQRARHLFRPGVLVGVATTGDGREERGHAFMVVDPDTGIALGIKGASLQVFKLTSDQIGRMRARGDLVSELELGSDSRIVC